MTKRIRFLTLLLAAAMSVVMFSSVAYIAAESDHACMGADCSVCHQLSLCEQLMETPSLAVSITAFAAALASILCQALFTGTAYIPAYTLVSLKVKLSN